MSPVSEHGDSRPVPDPTALTTEALRTEILHLRELIETRLDQNDKAVIAALASADKAVNELDTNTSRRIAGVTELTDAKFITYRALLDTQAEKVTLARDASDKAVGKSEVFNEKRFDILSKEIDEIKETLFRLSGRSAGLSAGWGYLIGAVGLVGAIVALVAGNG